MADFPADFSLNPASELLFLKFFMVSHNDTQKLCLYPEFTVQVRRSDPTAQTNFFALPVE
jgi:ATP phosphoribosyltransferase regulatory subunit HisZ